MTVDELLDEVSREFHEKSMARGNALLSELGIRLCSDSFDSEGRLLYHIGRPTIPGHQTGLRIGPLFSSGPEALVWLAHHEYFVRGELGSV